MCSKAQGYYGSPSGFGESVLESVQQADSVLLAHRGDLRQAQEEWIHGLLDEHSERFSESFAANL